MAEADSALTRIAHDHIEKVWGYLRFLGCSSDVADELAQDVFLTVAEKQFTYQSYEQTSALLRDIARHLYLNRMRRNRRREELLRLNAAQSAWQQLAGHDDGDGYIHALRTCLELLEDRQRMALELKYRDEADGDAIAEQLKVSRENVHTILKRGRQTLQRCIERRINHDE